MSTGALVLAAVVGLGAFSGCAAGDSLNQAGGTSHSTAVTIVSEDAQMITCGGGFAFEASAMEGGIDGGYDADEVTAALTSLVATAGIDAPVALQGKDVSAADWVVLAHSTADGDDELLLGTGAWSASGPGRDGEYVVLERTGDAWHASGWGTCKPEPLLPDSQSWVDVSAPPGGIDRAATSPAVDVSERQCTSGRDPTPFLNDPLVVEGEHVVTVYWTSQSMSVVGGVTCQGNATVREHLPLTEPLGDRRLLDGSTWPPQPVS